MRQFAVRFGAAATMVAAICQAGPLRAELPSCKAGWDGKRHISYQQQKDLFYNYYAQPGPYNGAAAQIYVSPLPVPPNVGHTWTTYQPLMPHEFLYKHQRAYYTHNPGAGWRRTNVRYGTDCLRCQFFWADVHYPMSNGAWALNNDTFWPGVRY